MSPLPTLNSLIKGGQVAEVHSWVVACSRVPASCRSSVLHVPLAFLERSCSASTSSHATFQSDSVTTLATIKEVLTKEATARKIQIQISVDVKEETVASLLPKIDLLVYQHELAAKSS